MMSMLTPPVAIRITRPYATESEFLENELDMLTRTTVTLVGAQPRPQGVVLRFELVLSSGLVVLRGEGRVLAFRPAVHRGMGGLTLRFTRLDTRSKALVDKVAALRDHRRPSAVPPPPLGSSMPPVAASAPSSAASLDEAILTTAPPPVVMETLNKFPAPAPSSSGTVSVRSPSSIPPPLPAVRPPAVRPAPPLSSPQSPLPGRLDAPQGAERDALLERLRTRAKALGAEDVQRILERGRQRASSQR
jgi:hypothetical protein